VSVSRPSNDQRGEAHGVAPVLQANIADPHEEIERLHSELAAFNKRIAELEKGQDQSPMIETLKATAISLSRQIDEVRCSIASERLAGLLAQLHRLESSLSSFPG
jgi:uncharacterized protein YydD (DUF2326 family)